MKIFNELTKSRETGLSICLFILYLTIISDLVNYMPVAEELFGINNLTGELGNSLLYPIIKNEGGAKLILLSLCLLFSIFIFTSYKFILFITFPLYYYFLDINIGFQDGSNDIIHQVLGFTCLYYLFYYCFPHKTQYRNLFLFGILIQICIIYAHSCIGKMAQLVWLDGGAAMYYSLQVDYADILPINKYLIKYDIILCGMVWFTLLMEGLFPILIWSRRTKLWIMLAGILLHVGIYLLIRIEDFSWVMIATYFLFFSDQEYSSFLNKYKVFSEKMVLNYKNY